MRSICLKRIVVRSQILAVFVLLIASLAVKNVYSDVVCTSVVNNNQSTDPIIGGLYNGQIGDYALVPGQTPLYNFLLFTAPNGSKFPYTYSAHSKGENTYFAATADNQTNSNSSVDWGTGNDGNPFIKSGSASIQISIPLDKIEGNINFLQFVTPHGNISNLTLTAYDSDGESIESQIGS